MEPSVAWDGPRPRVKLASPDDALHCMAGWAKAASGRRRLACGVLTWPSAPYPVYWVSGARE